MASSSTTVGDRIRELRDYKGFTQAQFGAKVGVGGGLVSAWENGSTRVSDGRRAIICNVFGVNPKWLTYGEGSMWRTSDERETALNYVSSILSRLPDDERGEIVGFLRDLVHEFDSKETVSPDNSASDTSLTSVDDDFMDDDSGFEDDYLTVEEDVDEVVVRKPEGTLRRAEEVPIDDVDDDSDDEFGDFDDEFDFEADYDD